MSGVDGFLVFPDSERQPALAEESGVSIPVSSLVAGDLLGPVPGVLTDSAPTVLRTPVPEASVDEDRDPLGREHEVGRAPQRGDGAAIHEVAQPEPVGRAANCKFGRGADAPLRLHAKASEVARRERSLGDPRWAGHRSIPRVEPGFAVTTSVYPRHHASPRGHDRRRAGIQLSLLAGLSMHRSADSSRQTGGVTVGTAISLFSGAGGLDLGVEGAGFRTSVAVEWNENAADTMEKNASTFFPGLEDIVRADLYPLATGADGGVTTRDILRAGGFARRERPDLLVGGPPCVAFSKSGFWLEWKRDGVDPAASLLQAYTRVLAEAKPRHFILENVYALTFDNRASRPAFERLLSEIAAAGYRYRWQVLNAADYGVPQARPRLFIIGAAKSEKLPELPLPTHHGDWERRKTGGGALPHVTAGTVLKDLVSEPEIDEEVRGQWGHLLPQIPPGNNYLYFTQKRGHPSPIFGWRSRYWSFLLKLDPHKPSPTIQAHPGPNVGPFHWENRRLRVPELRRLFTFPDSFGFVGRRSSVQAQVGNAVPPLLAQKVAQQVAIVLRGT